MIPSELQQLIDERIAQLPDYVQESLATFDWIKVIEEIGVKHRLGPEQIQSLVSETAMVILEIENPEIYAVNLKNHVGISDEIAKSIISDLNTRVFNRLQTELEHIVGDSPKALQQQLDEMRKEEEESMPAEAGEPAYAGEEASGQGEQEGVENISTYENGDAIRPQPKTPAPVQTYSTHDPYHEPIE